MGFPLFRKQQHTDRGEAAGHQAAVSPFREDARAHTDQGAATCFHSQCRRTEGWQCTFTDTKGNGCLSWWCEEHIEFVQNVPFCRRHARVAHLLLERVGSLYQIPVPDIGDRALPLLIRLTDQFDDRIVKLLRHLYRDNPAVQVAPHAMIRDRKGPGGHMGWEAVWSATSPSGYVATMALRVTGDEPPLVQLMRDGHLVEQGVPTWVVQRLEDGWHTEADDEFVNGLYGALVATFGGGHVAVPV